jgi:hypothetical protein
MSEDVKILRAVHGSAEADGSSASGRVSFRLSGIPERRWLEIFEATKGAGIATGERGTEFFLHVACAPGQVATQRDAAVALIAEVNSKWRAEVAAQSAKARERNDQKRQVEDALNRELEALNFDRS